MKIYLIHGEYSTKSYEKLKEYIAKAKEKNWKVINCGQETGFSLQETLSSTDLFNNKKVYILDSPSKLPKKDIDWININSKGLKGILLLYSNSKIKATIINKFKSIDKKQEFSLPKNIFSFLESFYPKNSVSCINLLHQLLIKEKIEFIFYFLSRHVRDLYWVKTFPSNIPYPSWRVEKLEKQASRFSLPQLKNVINSLSEIDIKSKTSKSKLIDLLDLLIIRKLE
ncbi:hypothetical protein KJ570_02300 [Patescibacteria group bacterium]|nr:hypothetical protein [Patescibacteria group bacterium]MBU2036060.1 hypothetical protein [Patescibacteria group bacterium]